MDDTIKPIPDTEPFGSIFPLKDSFVIVMVFPETSDFAHQIFETLIFSVASIVIFHESTALLPVLVIFRSYW